MKIKSFQILAVSLAFSSLSFTTQAQEKKTDKSKYRADWVSLRNHQTPSWLKDAKFGIYCHWGIQTLSYIPEYSKLPNDSLLNLWKGEKFKADSWAKLFETAGAKFGGVIAWHGSDLKHWDSQISNYNSAKLGPKIDILGELSKAVRKRNYKRIK